MARIISAASGCTACEAQDHHGDGPSRITCNRFLLVTGVKPDARPARPPPGNRRIPYKASGPRREPAHPFSGAVVFGIVALVRSFGHDNQPPARSADSRGVAAERFARGEIGEEEYRQRLAVLRGAGQRADSQALAPPATSARNQRHQPWLCRPPDRSASPGRAWGGDPRLTLRRNRDGANGSRSGYRQDFRRIGPLAYTPGGYILAAWR